MNRTIALGAYLVGLTAKIISIEATTLPTSDFRIELPGIPKERGKLPDSWRSWEQETRTRVRLSLALLGIDIGFSISLDHVPPFPPHIDLVILAACLGSIGKLPSAWFVECDVTRPKRLDDGSRMRPNFDPFSISDENPNGCKIFLGELGLQGQIRPTRGVLAFLVDYLKTRSEADERSFVVPYDNAIEASHVDAGTNVYATKHVSELFDLHEHTVARIEYRAPKLIDHIGSCLKKLPTRVVDAIVRAAIDGKPMHLIGSNADRAVRLLRSILPPMTREEAIESASLLSIAGLLRPDAIGQGPYQAPHHTVNERGLVGGDFPPRAGVASLAHNGLLYLPDLPQFKRTAIEVLAPVLREGKSSLWRRDIRTEFPARMRLVTSAKRCPCIGSYANGGHSEYCAERADRKSDPNRDEFYLGWQTRFCDKLGIETIVDSDFGPDDVACTDELEAIRSRVLEGIGR